MYINSDQLELVSSSIYLGSAIQYDGSIATEISVGISRDRLVFTNLKYLWKRRDVGLPIKTGVYNTSVCAAMIHGCETWSLCATDVIKSYRSSIIIAFDTFYTCNKSSVKTMSKFVNAISKQPEHRQLKRLSPPPPERRLCRLGRVLCMNASQLPRRVLYSKAGSVHLLTSKRTRQTLTTNLSRVGSGQLPGKGPSDDRDECL